MQGAVADKADLAELLVELLQGKEAEEAYQVLSARIPGDVKWKHPGFQDSLTSLAKAYVQQHKDLETRESPAWRALNRLAHPPAVCQEPEYAPVTRMLAATLERPTEEENSATPACFALRARSIPPCRARGLFRARERLELSQECPVQQVLEGYKVCMPSDPFMLEHIPIRDLRPSMKLQRLCRQSQKLWRRRKTQLPKIEGSCPRSAEQKKGCCTWLEGATR